MIFANNASLESWWKGLLIDHSFMCGKSLAWLTTGMFTISHGGSFWIAWIYCNDWQNWQMTVVFLPQRASASFRAMKHRLSSTCIIRCVDGIFVLMQANKSRKTWSAAWQTDSDSWWKFDGDQMKDLEMWRSEQISSSSVVWWQTGGSYAWSSTNMISFICRASLSLTCCNQIQNIVYDILCQNAELIDDGDIGGKKFKVQCAFRGNGIEVSASWLLGWHTCGIQM